MRRIFFAVIIGAGGLAILLYLGTWQVKRLDQKRSRIAAMDARIAAQPVALPNALTPDQDRYLSVQVTGRYLTKNARMLASRRQIGAVYRNISAFQTETGQNILVDLGWTAAEQPFPSLPDGQTTLVGNLDWPRETDRFTPKPDLTKRIWYARDVKSLAQELGTDPVFLVLRDMPDPKLDVTLWPVDTKDIPNDHLQYAITWFSLAAIWFGMTAYFLLRNRKSKGSISV